jgi:hypothetical protein
MTYTINGKPYTEFDINKRCAEIMEHKTVNYCRSAHYTLPIIDKCWNELNKVNVSYDSTGRMITSTKWNSVMFAHDCTKLTAACICLIELNE